MESRARARYRCRHWFKGAGGSLGRPVVIISRQSVIPLLRTVMVAPITSAIHGVPSEVMICTEQGLKRTSAINLDHVQTVEKSQLRTFVARLDEEIMSEVCRALGVATGCVG